jgi:ribonuclease HI
MNDVNGLPEVTIYTDGACDPNPGPGGWAALLLFGEHRKTLTGREAQTTNNRMELQAVISALEALKAPCRVKLHTDSEYVRRGVTEWMRGWKAKGWRTAGKKPVQNRDLWEALDAAMQRHQVEWFWVKGHAGDPHNEEVDRQAVSMIPRASLPTDDASAAHVYAAASCLVDSPRGGWAAVVRQGEAVESLSGHEDDTSANRLHVLAIVRGLDRLPDGASVHVYTPSDYAAQGGQGWVDAWARSGWRTSAGKRVRHADLWQVVLAHKGRLRIHWHPLKDETARPDESHQAQAAARAAALG